MSGHYQFFARVCFKFALQGMKLIFSAPARIQNSSQLGSHFFLSFSGCLSIVATRRVRLGNRNNTVLLPFHMQLSALPLLYPELCQPRRHVSPFRKPWQILKLCLYLLHFPGQGYLFLEGRLCQLTGYRRTFRWTWQSRIPFCTCFQN